MSVAEISTKPEQAAQPAIPLRELGVALLLASALVLLTRLPLARPEPFESDEFGFLERIVQYHLPIHHTLFLGIARIVGDLLGDPYQGFIVLDMAMSAFALVATWWWLRALVKPTIAAAATLVLAVSPTFWTYGAMAGNYTAIPLVGAILLGITVRTFRDPRPWHPYIAAVVLAFGAGYRQDIGTFWLPIFFVILWKHRWKPAIGALGLFVVLNLAWLIPMLIEVGGLAQYRAQSAEFANSSGYKNSIFYLGFKDATVRYAVKLGLALGWTFGIALLAMPMGVFRIVKNKQGKWLAALLLLSVVPPLLFHLVIHFGVPGYCFHYVPALLALLAMGVDRTIGFNWFGSPIVRLAGFAACSTVLFLVYVPDYDQNGARGSFDLSIGRFSRVGLVKRPPDKHPTLWRTANSINHRTTTSSQ
jgi:hypothetical protein